MSDSEPLRFVADELVGFAAAVLGSAGIPHDSAALIAGHAVDALATGEYGHGAELGLQYLDDVRAGTVRPDAGFEIVRETGTTMLVDGHMNFGHVVSHHVMSSLIAKAREQHVAAASIRYQTHVGRLIDYTSMAAEAGMIGLMMCDGAFGPKFMAPWGGTSRRLGLNPWSLAVPGPDGPVGFDMTSGATSLTKIQDAREHGHAVPPGWILDADGAPTTDPTAFWAGGSIAPHGGADGHKGYVLAFMIEILADVLSGMDFRHEPDRPAPIIDGCFMAVFDIAAFRPLGDFVTDLGGLIDYVHSSDVAEVGGRVYYPGERSARNRARSASDGVPVRPADWTRVLARARSVGYAGAIPVPLSASRSSR